MTIPSQRFRQVHLDFHTALECAAIGEHFDADRFADTLAAAHVNGINIFAKCHHGYSYYPTKVGTMHPGLRFDLLGKQIEALHHRDIRCPIYVSVMWDDLAATQQPGWMLVNKDGTARMRPPLSGEWGWSTMDVASGYRDYFMAQVQELMANYEVDGFWFDICFVVPNYSAWSQMQMRTAGVRIDDDNAVMHYAEARMLDFFRDVTGLVHSRLPDATIFYNGTVTPTMRTWSPYVTHFEVESLPTSEGIWGYLHYPIMGRQARTYGKDFLGMTGRFHKSWADFGGLKTVDQLDYECGTIVGAGGKICVGDQLHPNGELDPAVYRMLGESFARIEQLEPWLEGATPQTEVAILAPADYGESQPGVGMHVPDVEGAAQLFLEAGIQFDIVDDAAEFASYSAVVLPDGARLNGMLQSRLNEYLSRGGKLVLSGAAALDPTTGAFQLTAIPVEYAGLAPTCPSYLHVDAALAAGGALASDYDYVFYDQAHMVRPREDGVGRGELRRALFNRTWEHYTSHQHAPVGDGLESPLVVHNDQVLYFAAPLFSGYRRHDYWAYRAIVQNVLRTFLPPALIRPEGPGWVEFTLHHQQADATHPDRRIVHVVAYHPRRTLQQIPHVDQSWATSGLAINVRSDGATLQRAYLAPGRQSLPLTVNDGYVRVELPPLGPHAVVVLE